MQILVRDNNIEQALRVLKRKLQRDGLFRELRERRSLREAFREKTRRKAQAVRRARKLIRKQAEREGLLPTPPKRAPLKRPPTSKG